MTMFDFKPNNRNAFPMAVAVTAAILTTTAAPSPAFAAEPSAATITIAALKVPAQSEIEQRIKRLIKKLRKMNAPGFLLDAAEKALRLAMLHRVDQHLVIVLRDLEALAERLGDGEDTLEHVEVAVTEHSRWLSLFELKFAEQDAAIARIDAATARFNAAARRAEDAADRAEDLARATNKRLKAAIARTRKHRPCSANFVRRKDRCVDVRLHPARNDTFREWTD